MKNKPGATTRAMFEDKLDYLIFNSFDECGCCGEHHPRWFDGDCRDDNNRLHPDDLKEVFLYCLDNWADGNVRDIFNKII